MHGKGLLEIRNGDRYEGTFRESLVRFASQPSPPLARRLM